MCVRQGVLALTILSELTVTCMSHLLLTVKLFHYYFLKISVIWKVSQNGFCSCNHHDQSMLALPAENLKIFPPYTIYHIAIKILSIHIHIEAHIRNKHSGSESGVQTKLHNYKKSCHFWHNLIQKPHAKYSD